MRRTHLLSLGLLAAAPFAASCSEPSVPIGLVMVAPQAIGDAESVDLYVFEAGDVACNEDGTLSAAVPKESDKFSLSKEGCGEGLSWCGEIEVNRTDKPTMFAAIARAQGQTVLQGCTVTPVNQDPLEVTIEMKQYLEPACCGDGKLQPGEQCDPGGLAECGEVPPDEVCFANCTTAEVLLSVGGAKPPTDNAAGSKSEVAMAFCPGNNLTGTALRTLFRSTSNAVGGSDIHLRAMSPDGYTIQNPLPLASQMRLPMPCWDIYETPEAGVESTPAIAPVSVNATLMVYASNVKLSSSSDVYLIVHTEDVCADVPLDQNPAIQLSTTESTPGAITPDVARGPEGTALIVWNQKGQVVARLWKSGTLVPAVAEPPLTLASGALPKVAGSPGGFVVVYQSGGAGAEDIFKRSVDLNGIPGPEERVNGDTAGAQIAPDIAMLDSGSYAIVWQSADDIFFQRYAGGEGVSGDQEAPLNDDLPGKQLAPAIGAPQSGGTFFAAAWENEDGTISARFLGEKSGFLFNAHDGRNNSFPASHLGIKGTRHKPAVAIGNHVVFGWQDDSIEHPGTYIRRFPLPK